MARPLTQSDLIFPSQSLNFSNTLHSLKRSALSITNRLSSITSDSAFVISVSKSYNLPLVANERCGSWYIPPQKKAGSVYFKSTDGHMNEWSFNLRRLNLHVLDLFGGKAGGCVIVDSTRRGKSMPDALSKTIPIWCCVMNRAIFSDTGPHELHTPPTAVSASEHAQIEKRIDGFVQNFLDICNPNIPSLRRTLQKPLRPLWVTPTSTLPPSPPSFPDFHPIVLCTASRRVHGNEGSENGYIQGAADDHEAWACGLTPNLFWTHHETLLTTNEQDLPDVIANLVKSKKDPDAAVPILIKPTTSLFVSNTSNVDITPFDAIISCTPEPLTTSNPDHVKTKKYLHLPLPAGKLGSRDLRTHFPRIPAFIESLPGGADTKILICDPTGKDTSVGVALAILCMYADDEGNITTTKRREKVDKTFIKQRLSWITTTSPILNPSRETLKSVNAFLMPDPMASRGVKTLDEAVSKLVLRGNNSISAVSASSDIPISTTAKDLDASSQPALSSNPATTSVSESKQLPSLPTSLFTHFHKPSKWTFSRTLTSKLASHPSGTVTGTATFTPLTTSNQTENNLSDEQNALLYSEEGDFVTTTGLRFSARRKYIYRLNPTSTSHSESQERDQESAYISVHFAPDSTTNDENNNNLFVEMGPLSQNLNGEWEAKNRERHLCGEDLYTASWKFGSGMLEGGDEGDMWWEVRYDVLGPKKDYVSLTRYTL